MASPTYGEDLTDISTCESVSNWDESSDGTWDDGGAPAQDEDSNIQDTYCISAEAKLLKTGYMTIIYDNTTDVSIPTDGAVLVWQYYTAPSAIDTLANSGLGVLIGDGLGDFDYWATSGNDHQPQPAGGWANVAVNDTVAAKGTVGSPTGSDFIGVLAHGLRSISKGNPLCVDVMRYGRCESQFSNGEVADYCTFAGYAAANDADTAKWGLISAIAGGFLYKGLMSLGYGGTEAYFHDSDAKVTVDNSLNVTAGFNAIKVNDVDTEVYWTRVSFKSLCTVSPGSFEMVDNADVQWEACAFEDMGAFTMLSNFVGTNCAWIRCGVITANGADFVGSSVLLSSVAADASALVWNVATDPDGLLDDMTFTKGALAHHAIEFGSSTPSEVTLNGWTVADFNASDGQNDSVIYNNTGGALTVNIVEGSGTFSYKNGSGASTTIVEGVQTSVTVKDALTATVISGVNVLLLVADDTNFIYNDAVTEITGSGTTATVDHTGHGLEDGDKVRISGANQDEYNGTFTITYISASSYSYTTTSTVSASPATGTITATFALIKGTTDGSGKISYTTTYPSGDQPIVGWARKSTSSPYYKESPISDIVDDATGKAITVLMVSDE